MEKKKASLSIVIKAEKQKKHIRKHLYPVCTSWKAQIQVNNTSLQLHYNQDVAAVRLTSFDADCQPATGCSLSLLFVCVLCDECGR